MSILKTEIGTAIPNFLDSEVGLVTKTAQIPQSMGQTDGDRKTVFAGTVFPANTSAATGIVFEEFSATALLAATARAKALHRRPADWATVRSRAMQQGFGWADAARQYESLYLQVQG